MTVHVSDRVSGYLDAIRKLDPVIAQHRAAFDRERRLPDGVFDALANAGLFRLWLPKALGGPELSPLEFMAIVEAAAALDGSVGWIVGNGAGMSRAGGYLPEQTARAWFAEPRAFITSATGAIGKAVAVEGGYRVSGRWPFGSGAHHATAFMGLASASESPDPSPLCCYMAREAVTIEDTWNVSGLRGTGSYHFEARDTFVPAAQAHRFMTYTPSQPGLLYRMPALSVFAWTVSVVPLGIARGAIDAFIELAASKSRLGTALRDRETVQATVGRVDVLHRAARAFLADAMSELMVATDIGGEQLVRSRAMFRGACAHAAESAMGIVNMLAAAAGAVSIFESCALERAMRDINAAVRHIAMSPDNYTVIGRLGLGLDPGTSRF